VRSEDNRLANTPRIVVTGSECTGKTTLATQLSEKLQALLVPEFSRSYAASAGRQLIAADVSPIALGQITLEDAALASRPSLVIQDTDLLSTVVYARHYYGACPDWIVAAAATRLAPLYLLCNIDLPWIGDGIRDRPLGRAELDSLFLATLGEFGADVVRVSGLGTQRMQHALDAIAEWRASR